MSRDRKKPQKGNPKPKGVKYTECDGTFKLYKIWSGNKVAGDPFYITEDLAEMVQEIEDKCKIWGFKIDLKELVKFINKHNTEDNEQSNFPKSYLS